MVHVISCISYDADLLPHFVDYYVSLGVDSFIIAIDERVPGIFEKTAEIAARLPAKIQLVPASERHRSTGIEGNNKEETRRRFVSPDDWIIPADLDEFIQFPAAVPQIIDEMKLAGATFIVGYFSDRTAPDGVLAKTEPAPSIWEQYPLEAPVSEMLVGCWCHKVTLCRGDCELTSGHHGVIRPAIPLLARQCVIHHFKWRAGLWEALERRVKIYLEQKVEPRSESERILKYLEEHGRIVLEEFEAKAGWNPRAPQPEKENVIYTAISGYYDLLKDPPLKAQAGSELVAFIDKIQPSRFWKMKPIHSEFADPCRNAKIHKILPHIYFPKAKYSLWVDGSVQIKFQGSLEELAEIYLKERDMAVFAHQTRNCIYEEADACIKGGKDDPGAIYRQMMHYKYENYPIGVGLAECSVILRRHTEKVRLFNEVWWNEIKTHSRRDQLSFNYVAWKLSVRYALFPGCLPDNDLFFRHEHVAVGQFPIPRNLDNIAAEIPSSPVRKVNLMRRAERNIRSFRKSLFKKLENGKRA